MAKVSLEIPMLAGAEKPAKRSRKSAPAATGPAEYTPPSPHEMKVERAHSAHRDVIQDWVEGKASDRKVKQSKARLKKVVHGHI